MLRMASPTGTSCLRQSAHAAPLQPCRTPTAKSPSDGRCGSSGARSSGIGAALIPAQCVVNDRRVIVHAVGRACGSIR
jgi:hypothetical protein